MVNEQNGQQRLHPAGELSAKSEAEKEASCEDTSGDEYSKDRVACGKALGNGMYGV